MDNMEYNEVNSEHLLARYQKIHSEGDPDDSIEELSSKAREYLASIKYFRKFKAFDFYGFTKEFIDHSIEKKPGNKAWSFKDLQNVLQKLEGYGLRLLKRPWRREFHTIKLFTTFYKHDIESRLPSAVRILQLYGYRDVPKNMVKMAPESLDSNRIFLVCFELFLSSVELEVVSEICKIIEEEYTSNFTLNGVFKARRKTKGDVKEAVEYFLKENPDITRVKRIKTDDTGSVRKSRDKFDKSNKFPSEGEETSKTDCYSGRITSQRRTNRDTKYPPTSDNYSGDLPSTSDRGFAPVTVSAKVQHVISFDNFSDSDLYGHDDASSSQINENNFYMDTQEAQSRSRALHDPNYEDMTGAYGNDYEVMYGADTGDSSCTTLPPPPGNPPPTYDQATQIPGNDWVMIGNKDSDFLSNNISAMNIGENGQASRTSAELVGMRGRMHETPDIRRLKAASADGMGLTTTSYKNPTFDQIGPQGTSSKTEVVGSSALKKHPVEVKGMEDVSSERLLLTRSYKDYETPTTSIVTSFDKRQPGKSAHTFKTSGDPSKDKADSRRITSSLGSREKMSASKANDHKQDLKDRLVRSGPETLSSKRISESNVTTATHTYLTSSYGGSTTADYYSFPKTQSAMTVTTRSQAKAAAVSKPDVMSESLQGTKTTQKMTERYNKDNCIVCNSEATHYCTMCKKRSCKSCTTVVTRLPCESYKDHLLVEGSPTVSNDKADRDSEDGCSFCGVSTASHKCLFCNKKSCATCCRIYTKDPCVMDNETHVFVDEQQQKALDEQTASQKEARPSSKDTKPNPVAHVTGENYCDFCALAADIICKNCLKTICDKCKHVYKQDLCPPTKREHQFENINERSSNTNEATESSSWSCKRCTFLNSPSHRICAVCATSRGVNQVDMPKSGSRKCQNCTYGNEEGATVCKMCHRTFGLETPESYI